MKHKHYFLAILALVAASIWVTVTQPMKQGLDLKGGLSVILRAEAPEGKELTPGLLQDAKNVIQRRVDGLGVSEPLVQTKGSNQIVVELPDVPREKEDQALEQFQRLAMLRFVKIPEKYEVIHGDPATFLDKVTRQPVPASQVIAEGEVVVTGRELLPGQARSNVGNDSATIVELHFNAEGRKKFADFTMRNVKKYFGIFLDDEPISVPIIEEPIPSGDGVIRGSFSLEEAQELADLLNAGALPIPLKIDQTKRVGPTLGQESVDKSIVAGLVGLGLVALFMISYYRLPGAIAVVALCFYALFNLAVFKLIPVTLTLPGIAGFILSVGMAVDANILIFERLKEELNSGKTLRASIDAGFHRAFSSIFDSNMCSVITCAILYNFSSGPVRGFAVTLAIGVVLSMFTAITCTRTMLYMLVPTGLSQKPRLWGLGTNWFDRAEGHELKIVGRRNLYFLISGVVILTGVLFMGLNMGRHGFPVNRGIDFTGGSIMELRYEGNVPSTADIERALAGTDRADSTITVSPGEQRVTIRGEAFSTDAVEASAQRTALEKSLASTGKFTVEAFDNVGPTMGKDLTLGAIKAILLSSLLIIFYVAIRFSGFDFGVTAVSALVHDVLVLLGAFAVLGYLRNWEVDGLFVTAALTIIGYSVHDTIVVFDRIRENLRHRQRGESFDTVADKSVTETLARSINTSFTVLLVLVPLALLGGSTIRQFNWAMIIGLVAGVYSSIFNATAMLAMWRARQTKAQVAARKVEDKPMVAAAGAAAQRAQRPAPKPVETAAETDAEMALVGGGEEAKAKSAAKGPRNIKKKRRH